MQAGLRGEMEGSGRGWRCISQSSQPRGHAAAHDAHTVPIRSKGMACYYIPAFATNPKVDRAFHDTASLICHALDGRSGGQQGPLDAAVRSLLSSHQCAHDRIPPLLVVPW
ncbi:hypothetical protein WJX74_003491 [Apatococcus lobatus]|uniref:Uncharacterized protein n=1 Tax=Apatococcus lobatus TaxID=904363 RepID=A0AAW1RL40_9CHLO